jgi:hypothetical protein
MYPEFATQDTYTFISRVLYAFHTLITQPTPQILSKQPLIKEKLAAAVKKKLF